MRGDESVPSLVASNVTSVNIITSFFSLELVQNNTRPLKRQDVRVPGVISVSSRVISSGTSSYVSRATLRNMDIISNISEA